ncbi:MAG TPA: phage tail sheath subtilisin-like domain-containing protein [Chloroflexota bacterium]|nr:phage tail sheath subtilisin-like domain-containing protein [Chloroflexota bacterium]
MPVSLSYPGVYIQELPSGVRTITGVATSITAFVGSAERGPVNVPTTVTSMGDFERTFGGLSLGSALSYAVQDFFQNGGSQAIIVRLTNGAAIATLNLPTGAASPNDVLPLVAANPGAWGNNLSATVDDNTRDPSNTSLFNLTVSESGGATEKFLNVSIQPSDPRYVPRVLEQSSNLVRVNKDNSGNWIVPNVRPSVATTNATANSGSDGSALASGQFIGTNFQANKTGIYALENADLFNLLVIPPYLSTGDVDSSVITAAATYCESRRAMLLVDPPSSWTTVATATAGLASVGTNSQNAALFFPRIRAVNPLRENQVEDFTPSGAIAGIMARTDAQRGVWKAPAGTEATISGAVDLSVRLTDAENGELNPLGVNCLRTFPVTGTVVWGARTLQGADRLASDWKYIPVRRLALYIEESLYRGTQWVVFEPNDEPLWSQIRLNVGAFMHDLFRKGAFQGKTPNDAYFVKCDSETTTQTDINQGIVNILVGFAPLKPAEFVVLSIQQMAGQIQA